MIFKLDFPEMTEYAQAKHLQHLQKEYKNEYGDSFLSVKAVTIIEEEAAKTIMLKDSSENETFSLYDAVIGDEFLIVSSTDWD